MKLTTKTTIKFFLIISLFASVGFADDGNMPGGGRTDGSEIVCDDEGNMPGGGIVCCDDEGNMPGGGYVCGGTDNADDGNMPGGGKFDDSILIYVKNYLFSLFG